MYEIKLLQSVGKTWLLNRILGQEVPCKDYQPTFIANFHTRTTTIDGAIVKLEIWSAILIIYTLILLLHAGTYLAVTSFLILVIRKISLVVIIVLPGLMFYPGSSAVILAYDITRRDTMDTCLARDSLLVDMEVDGRL